MHVVSGVSSSKQGSSTGQQQFTHSLQYRRPFGYGDSDQERLQPRNDDCAKADGSTKPSNSDQTESVITNPSGHVTEQSSTSSSSRPKHSNAADHSDEIAPQNNHTGEPPSSSKTQPPTPPPRKNPSDNLTISDLTLITIALTPALLHLWARCFFSSNSTSRLLGTWFALLTFPISTPLYRWDILPSFVRDALEVMSYGSAWTISVDISVALYRGLMLYPPSSEWECLVFYPGVVAAGVCWVVVVGFLWAVVVC